MRSLLLFVFIAVMIVGIGGLAWLYNNATISSVFRSDDLGISFSYPVVFSLKEFDDGVNIKQNESGLKVIFIRKYPSINSDPDISFKLARIFPVTVTNEKNITGLGRQELSFSFDGSEGVERGFVFDGGNDIYVFYTKGNATADSKFRKGFDLVISTVRSGISQ